MGLYMFNTTCHLQRITVCLESISRGDFMYISCMIGGQPGICLYTKAASFLFFFLNAGEIFLDEFCE